MGQHRTYYEYKITHGNDQEVHTTTPKTRQVVVEAYTTDRQKTTVLPQSMQSIGCTLYRR
jgi:hypothetical protein